MATPSTAPVPTSEYIKRERTYILDDECGRGLLLEVFDLLRTQRTTGKVTINFSQGTPGSMQVEERHKLQL